MFLRSPLSTIAIPTVPASGATGFTRSGCPMARPQNTTHYCPTPLARLPRSPKICLFPTTFLVNSPHHAYIYLPPSMAVLVTTRYSTKLHEQLSSGSPRHDTRAALRSEKRSISPTRQQRVLATVVVSFGRDKSPAAPRLCVLRHCYLLGHGVAHQL